MKKFQTIGFFLLSVIAIAAFLQSCSKEESPGGPETSLTELRLTSGVVIHSKASYPQADVQITEGEEVMVYVDRASAEAEQLYSQKMTADGAGNLTGATTMYFPENGDKVNIYALHTNSAAVTAGSFPTTFTHTVSTDQTTLDAYVSSDLLYAKAADIAKTVNAVPLQFYHQLSKLRVAIVAKDGIGQEDISEITINGLKSSADVTLSKEAAPDFLTVTASGDPKPIKIGSDLSSDFSDENIRFNDAIIVPQELTAGTEFLKISFADGKEVTSDLYSGISFASGKQYTIEITLDKGLLSLATSVSDWVDGEIVPINIDITSSFDPAFAKELQTRGYIPDANRILAKDVADITELDVLGTYDAVGELTSLKGIEYFTSLKHLNCNYNKLTSLDLSNNTVLESLNCADNELTSLDVSNNTALWLLNCSSNFLTLLDISNNVLLNRLYCSSNSLTTLDISSNTSLRNLYCGSNKLTSLNISNNKDLIELQCSSNLLTELDISKNTALITLHCSSNLLTKLDISYNTALRYLGCVFNSLTSLDVSNNAALENLFCGYNSLTSLDISNNTTLKLFACHANLLTSLDVSNNTALEHISCSNNSLTSLDVSKNTALWSLVCNSNKLTSLDVSKNTALRSLVCNSNKLTTLDVSNNTALTSLECYDNQLTTLDVSNNTALTSLECYDNQLTTLDVSNNTALKWLHCDSNQLTSLDVSNNTALKWLHCDSNQLTSLDIRNNKLLVNFSCYNNPGDGTEFNVAAWFGNDNIPADFEFSSQNWTYGDKTISLNFYIPE